MIAPMLGGMLLMISRSPLLYASTVVFVFMGFCVLMLKEDEGEGLRWLSISTVEPALSHTSQWTPKSMPFRGL
jgi:hypothetical protein